MRSKNTQSLSLRRSSCPGRLGLATLGAIGICFSCLSAEVRGEDGPAKRFLAGAAASNITPWLGTSINGGMRDRTAAHVHDELHARSIVLDNGDARVAIVVCDSCVIPRELFDSAKRSVHEHTGIPISHMLMAATHTHSAPTAAPVFQSETDSAYRQFLTKRIADAVRRAANNLAPAEIGWGVGREADQVFNRRWHMKEGAMPAGPFEVQNDRVKMNPPRGSPDLVRPAGPTDPQVPVISIRSPNGRPVSVLANYALHYVGGVPGNQISADYFGVFADQIQRRLGADRLDPPFVGILTNGASGNINNVDFRVKRTSQAPYEQMRIVGTDVADEAYRTIRNLRYREDVALDVRERRIQLGVRKPDADDLARAEGIVASLQGAEARTLKEVYALETVKLADYPDTVEVILQAMRIGDVGIVAIPCEVFVEVGLEIKSRSPFDPTVVIELANGYNGYLPTPEQHRLGGYETWRARSSYLAVDASERIVETLLAMLNDLKASLTQ